MARYVELPPLEVVNDLLTYCADTGRLFWRKTRAGNAKAGMQAGNMTDQGYMKVKLMGRQFLAHRIAWLVFYGRAPLDEIDHINGIRHDNRIINLRNSSHRSNCQNLASHRKGRLAGTTFVRRLGKWQAQAIIERRPVYLGCFETEQQAHAAYIAATSLGEFKP